MAKLHYAAHCSLDGYVEDADGQFQFARPDDELSAYVNELERPIATHLYGRRMYETMLFWETNGTDPDDDDVSKEWARIWRAADKVVFSRTLTEAPSARTRIERAFDVGVVQQLKDEATTDLTIAGAQLAGQALDLGLLDEVHLFVAPVLVGAGKRALPSAAQVRLTLVGDHRFAGGQVHLHYRVAG